jgi:hypothetical protein
MPSSFLLRMLGMAGMLEIASLRDPASTRGYSFFFVVIAQLKSRRAHWLA